MSSSTILDRIIHNPLVRTFVIFISGGWIILEITDYIIENYGLNEQARNILLIILLSILPVALFLSWYLNRKQRGKGSPSAANVTAGTKRSPLFTSGKIIFPVILILLAVGVTFGFRTINRFRMDRLLNGDLPKLIEEVKYMSWDEGKENWRVYNTASELQKILKNNHDYINLWEDISVPVSIATEPAGAKVYAKPYALPDTSWTYLGEAPLTDFPFPRGLSRIKIALPGFEDQYDILFSGIRDQHQVEPRAYKLYRPNEKPAGMERARAYRADWNSTGTLPALNAGDFWIDKYELTNKAYQVFVDSGGYLNPAYWNFPFVDGEDTLDWDAAMERFKDKTGRFGPASWVMGAFPSGEDNFPVSGVSWYEAAAYADFADKELPTIFHWTYLAEIQAAAEIVKFGNFGKRGPAETGTYQGMTRYGTFDLPGNLSEWIFNANREDRMFIGGNFQEPSYFYNYSLNASPWTRNDRIGFRCMRYINDTLRSELTQAFDYIDRDFSKASPVSDEVFAVIEGFYRYEMKDLNPRPFSTKDSVDWTLEVILVDVPYEHTPMQINVFLPKNTKPPFQTVIYYPHIGSRISKSVDDMPDQYVFLDFLMKSGRAVVWPVYYATHGRGELTSQGFQASRQRGIYAIVDFQITCDYLASRNDIDTAKLAYYGISWGGNMAPYILAVEDRVKLGILGACGVQSDGSIQEFDQINYLPRIKIPMLMLNGRYDFDYTMKQQQAFYDFLGTPQEDKLWIKYEYTHGAPVFELINESLKWLDRYFGPVNESP